MTTREGISTISHLLRRAGFGASREKIEEYAEIGYAATVEELLNPEKQKPVDIFDLYRYQPWTWKPGTIYGMGHASWLYRMLNTTAPLQEKMTLFWHGVFATGVSKVDHWDEVVDMVDSFRAKGLGSFREILLEVAKNPAMLYWLDNNENHVTAVNENWGRELLELFSMGVGNYTEEDVRECSRAFTGWTMTPKLPRFPMNRFDWYFEYKSDDHDHSEKWFLGHTGRFNGEDIVDIVCGQPATARFIARHLYNFFVSDESQVPAWSVVPAKDPEAIDQLAKSLLDSDYDIRSTLRFLFNASFFKKAEFQHLKSPAEVVVGTLKLVGGSDFPAPGLGNLSMQMGYMGQDLLNPPSVEGWHTGPEWINSGSLMRRTNFFTDMLGDPERPGVKLIIKKLKDLGELTPEQFVDTCLDLMGPLDIGIETKTELISHAVEGGNLRLDATKKNLTKATDRITEMLQLIASLREYQFA